MLTLALDTATKVCSIALCRDKEILAEYTVNMGMTHSEGLLPQIEQLLQRCRVAKKDIGLLAVSMGPGSFTGLRIGLACAEAMAYSWQCCLHGVDTLEALAYNLPVEGLLLSPVIDAQKGNYYQALYTWRQGKPVQLAAVEIVSRTRLLERLQGKEMPVVLLGECLKLAQQELPPNVSVAPEALRMPRGGSVALAAEAGFDAAQDKKIFGLEPYYIRRSEAEELWEQKQKK